MKNNGFVEQNGAVAVKLIKEKRLSELRCLIADSEPEDIALMLGDVPSGERLIFFRCLTKECAAECFVALDTDIQLELINGFTDAELGGVVNELFLDDTVDIIEEMPANVVKKILRSTTSENREAINRLLGYPHDSAGSLMTPEYVRLSPDMTVGAAMAHIRSVALDSETIYTCYVTDAVSRLVGIVTAKQLLISDPEQRLSGIMNTSAIYVNTLSDRSVAVNLIKKYGLLALPVVDNESRLVGIVTIDDAIDAMSQTAEEDFAKMAAITPSDAEYLKTPVFSLFRARIPWLLLLLISAVLSSAMLARFEAALPAVLVLFVPMLMDTGGNCGSQASVTVIRSISLGTVTPKNTPSVLFKELRVGLLCASALAAAAFLKITLIDGLVMGNSAVSISVALAVSASLAVTVILAKMIGAALPIFVKLIGFDPAVMASPFITTVIDALSLVIYFVIAGAVLS